MTELLTVEKWREIVKMHLRRAFAAEWDDARTIEAMDYCGERLIEDRWSVAKTTWAVREVCRKYRKLEQPLAMICQTADGLRSRDGDIIGGWLQSREFRELAMAEQDDRDRQQCITELGDGLREAADCGQRGSICAGCVKLAERPRHNSGRSRDENPQGGFKRVGELLPPEARNA